MPLDPHECHEYAQRCMDLAAETTDPDAQEISGKHRSELGASRLQVGRRPRRSAGAVPRVNLCRCHHASATEPSLVRASRYRRFDARLRLDHVHDLFTRKPARSKYQKESDHDCSNESYHQENVGSSAESTFSKLRSPICPVVKAWLPGVGGSSPSGAPNPS